MKEAAAACAVGDARAPSLSSPLPTPAQVAGERFQAPATWGKRAGGDLAARQLPAGPPNVSGQVWVDGTSSRQGIRRIRWPRRPGPERVL